MTAQPMFADADPVPGPIPHGTSSGYTRHKCRCDACRSFEIARQRAWRQRHREGKVEHRVNHPSCVPVRVRGVDYPSISSAAAFLGVCPSSISGQLRLRGAAEGTGMGARAPRRRPRPANAKRCIIHGHAFPSIGAAARALGVSYAHLSRQLNAGPTPRYAQHLLVKLMAAGVRA